MPAETIAAVATPPGRGGVGVVRVSGPKAREILERLFLPARPDFFGFTPRRMHLGSVRDRAGNVLDQVLAVLMPGPASLTGEDVAEIHGHGGPAVLASVLDEALALGARLARPGEFTLRAFLAGKLDLTQAEAVAELVNAPCKAAASLALASLSGLLGERVRGLRARLEELRAQLCLAVDFPEDELDCPPPERIAGAARGVIADIEALLNAAGRARVVREGALLALVGPVNAGKSSLMNALLGRTRALVAATPCTTRDFIEEPLVLDGLPVRLADTAGLRETEDEVERAGLALSRDLAAEADLVLFVADGARPPDPADSEAALACGPSRVLALANKRDLPWPAPSAFDAFAAQGLEVLAVSAKTGEGLDALCRRVRERLLAGAGEPDPEAAAPNARQARSLTLARDELSGLVADAEAGLPHDILSVRLDAACRELAGITGEIAPEDVLADIFSRFCIGK